MQVLPQLRMQIRMRDGHGTAGTAPCRQDGCGVPGRCLLLAEPASGRGLRGSGCGRRKGGCSDGRDGRKGLTGDRDPERAAAGRAGMSGAVGNRVLLRSIVGRAAAPGRNRLGQLLTSLGRPRSRLPDSSRSRLDLHAVRIAKEPQTGPYRGAVRKGFTPRRLEPRRTWILHPCHTVFRRSADRVGRADLDSVEPALTAQTLGHGVRSYNSVILPVDHPCHTAFRHRVPARRR